MTRDDKKEPPQPCAKDTVDHSLGPERSMKPRIIRVRSGTVGPSPKRRKKSEAEASGKNKPDLEDIRLRNP